MCIIAIGSLLFSALKSREKTMLSLQIAWKTFKNVLPFILTIIVVIGFLLTFVPGPVIAGIIGKKAGFLGVIIAAIIGSILLVPHFIAAPLGGSLLRQGAGITSIAAFITTLVMVGIVTAPMESKLLGKKFTLWRNLLSFGFALLIAVIMGSVLK